MGARYVGIGVFLLSVVAVIGHVSAASDPASSPFLFTIAKKYVADAWLRGEERFPSGSQVYVQTGIQRRLLVSGFQATADPAVSFDGLHVLFAGKEKPANPWQVYQAEIDGSNVRRVTSAKQDCIRPLYLPGDRFVYARKVDGRFAIEAAPLAGGAATSLTYWPANSLPTDVLRDGRILFEAGFPSGGGPISELFTVYADGSGVESYRCDHNHSRSAGRQMGSGDILFAQPGGLGRFTSAQAQQLNGNAPRGEYAGDVAETASGDWIVAWRSHSPKPFALRLWKPESNRLQPLAGELENDVVQPVVLAARATPNRHPSGLHDWNYANLLCLNAYTSKLKFTDGSIETVELRTLEAAGMERVLGTAHVEKDGSFYLRTPADRPLKIALLDHDGKILHQEKGWFWLRRGEQRVCVGCHAGPETAPENAVPSVLLRSTIPADMTGAPAASKGGQ